MEIPSCEHCGRRRRMMVTMAAGKDGKPWHLCPRCWEDGLRSIREPVATPPPAKTKPGIARGSQSTIPRAPAPVEPEPEERTTQHRFTGGTGSYVPDDDGYW